ncbi:hypothetical protein [Elizabethkingia ursingii]
MHGDIDFPSKEILTKEDYKLILKLIKLLFLH